MKKHLLLTTIVTGLVVLAAVTKGTGPDTVFGSPVEADDIEIVETQGTVDDETSPEDASGEEEDINGIMSSDGDWSYIVNDNDEAVIVGYMGTGSSVRVPAEIDTKKVTSIVPGAFKGKTYIGYVYMPDSIKTLPSGIFTGCTGLYEVRLGGVTELPEALFKGCSHLSAVYLFEGVTDIPASFCEGCSATLYVYLPKTLKTVGENAFKDSMSSSAKVYYAGNETDWAKVSVSPEGNDNLLIANRVYNYDYSTSSSSSYYGTIDSTGNWRYSLDDGNATINTYVGPRKDEVTIPAVVDEYKVHKMRTGVSNTMFDESHKVKKVIVSDGVDDLEDAFSRSYVDEVILPKTLVTLGDGAFKYSDVSNVTFPSSLETIGENAFTSCPNLVKLELPSKLKTIGDNAFSGSGLESLTIPGSVENIGYRVCEDCDNLKKLTLGSGITDVPDEAFYGVTGMTEVVIPSTLKTIGYCSFADSGNLAVVNFPDGLVSIGEDAFNGCHALGEITIPATVTAVDEAAFGNCGSLKNIYIKRGATGISCNAFENDYANVWYEGTEAEWKDACTDSDSVPATVKVHFNYTAGSENDEDFVFEEKSGNAVLKAYYGKGGKVTIPATATVDGSSLTVTGISDNVFSYNSSITSVELPSTLKTIGNKTFYRCKNLSTINLDEVGYIGENAFSESGIESVVLGEAYYIDEYAFFGCPSLTGVTFTAYPAYMGESIFEEDPALTKVVLSDDFKELSKYMFYSCEALEQIILPADLEVINVGALSNTGLKSITIPGDIQAIGMRAFSSCDNLVEVKFTDATCTLDPVNDTAHGDPKKGACGIFSSCYALKTITLPSGLKSIGWDMFSGSGLESIVLPESVKTIGSGAFYRCDDLTDITIQADEIEFLSGEYGIFEYCTSLKSVDGILNKLTSDNIPYRSFYYCTSLSSVNIPAGIAVIGSNAFCNCSKLTSVNMSQVERIGSYAFDSCRALREVELPDTLKDSEISGKTYYGLGQGAFDKTGLMHIAIPDGITIIPDWTFYNCKDLYAIYIPGSVKSIGQYSFSSAGIKHVYYEGSNSDRSGITNKDEDIMTSKVTWHYNSNAGDDPNIYENGFICEKVGAGAVTIIGYAMDGHDLVIPATIAEKKVCGATYNLFSGDNNIYSLQIDAAFDSYTYFPLFTGCKNLKSVKINSKVTDGTGIPSAAFKNCFSLESVDVGENAFGSGCFEGCSSLREVKMDDSLYEIGSGAFSGCSALESIKLPANLTEIPYGCFSGCGSLESISGPVYLYKIGEDAFGDCVNLRSVMIGRATAIDENAFKGCVNLKTVYSKFTKSEWDGYKASGAITIKEEGNEAFHNAELIFEYAGPESFSFENDKYSCNVGEKLTVTLTDVYPAGVDASELSKLTYKSESDVAQVAKDSSDPMKCIVTVKEPGMTRISAVCGAARAYTYLYSKYGKPVPVVDGSYITGLEPGAVYKLDDYWYRYTADQYGRIEIITWYPGSSSYSAYFSHALVNEMEHSIVRVYEKNENCNSEPATFTLGKRADTPAEPEVVEVSRSVIKVKPITGYEYTIDTGLTVNETGVFTGLVSGTTYTVGCRIKKTGDYEASGWRYKSIATEGVKPPTPDPSDDPDPATDPDPTDPVTPSPAVFEPSVAPSWDVKAVDGNTVTFVPKSEYKDDKGNPVEFAVKTTISVNYTGKKHVSTTDKVKKSTSNDVEITFVSPITEFADVSVKFKNNKIVPLSGGKQPQFVITLKAKKTATPEQKQLVKAIAKDLKKKPVYFIIAPADLTGATVNEIKTDAKKTKVSKVIVAINGNTFKLSKKDFDYKFEDGIVTITGKGNFKGIIKKSL